MTKSLQKASAALVNWDDAKMQKQIKESYGKELNEPEWNMFLALGQATGLNPFLREIWAVKYGGKASIFIGRDGYRRSAQSHPEYEYHTVDAVYSKDVLKMVNGELTHDYNLTDRGDLVGAYCLVKRKSATRPAFNYVELKEYKQPHGVWPTKPATMIKKVAEAQGLRAGFQELFAGTFDEAEQWQEDKGKAIDVTPQQDNGNSEQEVNSYLDNATTEQEIKDIIQELITKRTWNGEEAKRINARVAQSVVRVRGSQAPQATRVETATHGAEDVDLAANVQDVFPTGEVTRASREEMLEDMKSQDLDPLVKQVQPELAGIAKLPKRTKINLILDAEFPSGGQASIPVPAPTPAPAAPKGDSTLESLFAAK